MGEVSTLKKIHTSKGPQGAVILSTLHESSNMTPANIATLNRWDAKYGIDYLLAVEVPPYEPRIRNPIVWVIDAETMKIWSREVYGTTGLENTVAAALAASTRP